VTEATATAPRVGVVVVNYDGGDLTLRCIDSIEASEWPRERISIVLVDNASSDGVADRVEREHSRVHVVRNARNLGFAGGCNRGIDELVDVDFVALVNNDAVVEPGWLAPLVAALESDPELGAACPKILFEGEYRDVVVRSPTTQRGHGDHRDLGVRVSGARVDGHDVWGRVQLVRGFWGTEPPDARGEPDGQWTTGDALLRVPLAGDAAAVALRVEAPASTTVEIGSDQHNVAVSVGPTPTWIDAPLAGPDLTIINNTGSVLTADGHGADRGYLEVDDGSFDEPDDVFAWCGGAVLLRRSYLDDVGHFDERLFVYYEDLELSWRGHERGWRYRYVPASVVRHRHAATTGEGSALKMHYDERNRLLVLARHAKPAVALRAAGRHLLVTGSYARRDIANRVLQGRAPHGGIAGRRLRAFGGYLLHIPGMVRSRLTWGR